MKYTVMQCYNFGRAEISSGGTPCHLRGQQHHHRGIQWLEAIPMVSSFAQVCTNSVICYWIARFGIPTLITSDRGPNSQDGVASPVSEDGDSTHLDNRLSSTG